MRRSAWVFAIALLWMAFGARAQEDALSIYRWEAADLAFWIPSGWALETAADDRVSFTLPPPSEGARAPRVMAVVLPVETQNVALLETLITPPISDAPARMRYQPLELWGRLSLEGWQAEGYDTVTGELLAGWIGRLPDGSPLALMTHAVGSPISVLQAWSDALAFSAADDPAPPVYQTAWRVDVPLTAGSVFAVAMGRDGAAYLAGSRAVYQLWPAQGWTTFAYDNPAQPTSLAIEGGELFMGDTACRCIRRLYLGGGWGSLGAFAANYPTTIVIDEEYGLFVNDRISGETVIDRLDLITDTRERVDADALLTGDRLAQAALVAAITEQNGRGLQHAITTDGALLLALEKADGAGWALELRRRDLPADRRGGGGVRLSFDVPVQGTLTEAAPQQEWAFTGGAGAQVTINAVDLARAYPEAPGLDMELILYAPDGRLLARNDDHGGADLYGVYDAGIADLVLPADGAYRLVVSRVAGEGGYTLHAAADRALIFDSSGVARGDGALSEAMPVQRWTFTGRAGEAITVTMDGAGALDAALELLDPNGDTAAYIDDAVDTGLGVDAQIARFTLPADGEYVIEASRTLYLDNARGNGSGGYSLIVVNHAGG